MKNRKGMIDQMQVIGTGIIALVIIIAIGALVITKVGNSVAVCAADYTYNDTQVKCVNATNEDPTDPANAPWVALNYGNTQIGTTGLLSWLPAIIALLVGVWFLSYFAGRNTTGKEY